MTSKQSIVCGYAVIADKLYIHERMKDVDIEENFI